MSTNSQTINQFFDEIASWTYQNEIFYISGRDLICILIGVLISIITVLTVWALIGKDDGGY